MKIGVVGFGFVGKATSLLSHPSFEYYIYDIRPENCFPKNTSLKDLEQSCDILFICLPTPMNIDGSCDTTQIEKVLKQIDHSNIVIRSTVPIGFCDLYNVFFMPEFLTEANWKEDFIKNPEWLIGLPHSAHQNLILENIIRLAQSSGSIRNDKIIYRKSKEAEMVKLVKNAFLSTKVSFFNEIYDLCLALQINYDQVKSVVGLDPRLGSTHMNVPNGGDRGYGGTCFPKDTNHLYTVFCKTNVKNIILESNLLRNEFVDRPGREWLKDKNRTISEINDKIIMVTGGAGFIGSNLCHRLIQEGSKVICVDNLSTGKINNIESLLMHPNFVFRNHDVTQQIFIPHVDEIYHLACPASPPQYQKNPLKTIKTSIKGLWNILKICKQQKCKLLFTSTSEVYGDPLIHPQTEEYWGNVNPLGSRSCYDESKRLCETTIYEYQKKHQLDLKIVRIFNTYGPRMDIDDGRIVTNIMKSRNLIVNGDGNQTRSFCYIDDMIDGLLKMMNSDQVGPINLGNPECEVTINELIRTFEKISQVKINIEYQQYDEDDPKQRKPDISKAKQLLGWEPKINLEQGLIQFWMAQQ